MTSTIAPTYRALASGDRITGYSIRTKDGTTYAGEFHTTVGDGKLAHFMGGCDRSSFHYINLYLADDPGVVILTTSASIFALDGYR